MGQDELPETMHDIVELGINVWVQSGMRASCALEKVKYGLQEACDGRAGYTESMGTLQVPYASGRRRNEGF